MQAQLYKFQLCFNSIEHHGLVGGEKSTRHSDTKAKSNSRRKWRRSPSAAMIEDARSEGKVAAWRGCHWLSALIANNLHG